MFTSLSRSNRRQSQPFPPGKRPLGLAGPQRQPRWVVGLIESVATILGRNLHKVDLLWYGFIKRDTYLRQFIKHKIHGIKE